MKHEVNAESVSWHFTIPEPEVTVVRAEPPEPPFGWCETAWWWMFRKAAEILLDASNLWRRLWGDGLNSGTREA